MDISNRTAMNFNKTILITIATLSLLTTVDYCYICFKILAYVLAARGKYVMD